MVASRRVSDSQSNTVTSLGRFHLKAWDPVSDDFDEFGEPVPVPSLNRDSKTANEHALRRLEELTRNGLRGSLEFRHLDQALELVEPETTVPEDFLELSQVSGDNFLHCDDDLMWHWVDAQTLYKKERL